MISELSTFQIFAILHLMGGGVGGFLVKFLIFPKFKKGHIILGDKNIMDFVLLFLTFFVC